MKSLKHIGRTSITSYLVLFFVVILATSCGPKVEGLRQDPGFGHSAMQSDKVGIGGVTTLVHELAEEDKSAIRAQMADLLRTQLAEKRPDLAFAPNGVIINAIGEEAYTDMMDRFRIAGTLDSLSLAQLKSEIRPHMRYLVFGRIDTDVITHDTDTSEDTNDADQVRKKRVYKTKRTLSGTFQVCDILEGREVWSGLVTSKLENEETAYGSWKNPGESSGGILGALETVAEITDLLVDTTPEEKFPEPPDLTMTMEKLFRDFARSTPKKD